VLLETGAIAESVDVDGVVEVTGDVAVVPDELAGAAAADDVDPACESVNPVVFALVLDPGAEDDAVVGVLCEEEF
jgi:hypothetical protein